MGSRWGGSPDPGRRKVQTCLPLQNCKYQSHMENENGNDTAKYVPGSAEGKREVSEKKVPLSSQPTCVCPPAEEL